jgi:hypothetical protein
MNASNPFFLSRSPSHGIFNDLFLVFSASTVDVSPIFGLVAFRGSRVCELMSPCKGLIVKCSMLIISNIVI